MCFLFRLDLRLYAGVRKKFRILVFATKYGHSFDEEVDGGISMTAYQLDTPVRKPRSLSYGACVSRTLAVQVSFVASHRIAIACVRKLVLECLHLSSHLVASPSHVSFVVHTSEK